MINTIELTRINNDVNGNPRYVVHFLELVNENDKKEAGSGVYHVRNLYSIACKKANTIGGRKYTAKSYGGGIVFQSYNTDNLIKLISELKNK